MKRRWTFDSEDGEAARAVRRAFVDYLRERATRRSDIHSAELVYGELTGNVARHAPGKVEVVVDWSDDGQAVLVVGDVGSGFPKKAALPLDALSETGRGLYLVSKLSERIEVEHVPHDGTRVHAFLDVYRSAESSNYSDST